MATAVPPALLARAIASRVSHMPTAHSRAEGVGAIVAGAAPLRVGQSSASPASRSDGLTPYRDTTYLSRQVGVQGLTCLLCVRPDEIVNVHRVKPRKGLTSDPTEKGRFRGVRSDKRAAKPSDPTVFTGIFGSVTRSDPRKQAEKPLRPDSDPNEFFGGLNPRGQQQ